MANPITHYDVLIVGAGVAGSALAHGLSTAPRPDSQPLRIALLERSLSEPDRIVGELMQPGGIAALQALGLESCTENIDAAPVHGYCVYDAGKTVHIPYPDGRQGRSFHHGKFIMALREKAKQAKGVDVIEATVTDLIECEVTHSVIGVKARRENSRPQNFYATLVIIADGCFSNFRSVVLGKSALKSSTRSHFIGAVLENAELPIKYHGTVALVKGYGPVLFYQIGTNDTRMLVDVKAPLPSDLKSHILKEIVPQLPPALHSSIQTALSKDRIRRMPNSFLPPVRQSSALAKEGVLLIGDSWNMRHPLTGGGMTVALNDVVILRDLLSQVETLSDWREITVMLEKWHWIRKPLSSTVNILSVALYDLFGADGEELEVLRTGCFKYFERGGECVNGPVSLLAAIAPSPALLFYHFFCVAFYAIWVMFTHSRKVPPRSSDEKPRMAAPGLHEYPELIFKSFRVFWTAVVVFGPLLWSEIRWWTPSS